MLFECQIKRKYNDDANISAYRTPIVLLSPI